MDQEKLDLKMEKGAEGENLEAKKRGWEAPFNKELTAELKEMTLEEFRAQNVSSAEMIFGVLRRIATDEEYSRLAITIEDWGQDTDGRDHNGESSVAEIASLAQGYSLYPEAPRALSYHYDELDNGGKYGFKVAVHKDGEPEGLYHLIFLPTRLSDSISAYLRGQNRTEDSASLKHATDMLPQLSRQECYARSISWIQEHQTSAFGDWREDLKNIQEKLASGGADVSDFDQADTFRTFTGFRKDEEPNPIEAGTTIG